MPLWSLRISSPSGFNPAKPFDEHGLTGFGKRPVKAFGIRAQATRVDFCARQFGGVADEPAFEARGIDFRMELHAQDIGAFRERLRGANRRRREMVCAFRNNESVSMPMQDRNIAQVT